MNALPASSSPGGMLCTSSNTNTDRWHPSTAVRTVLNSQICKDKEDEDKEDKEKEDKDKEDKDKEDNDKEDKDKNRHRPMTPLNCRAHRFKQLDLQKPLHPKTACCFMYIFRFFFVLTDLEPLVNGSPVKNIHEVV